MESKEEQISLKPSEAKQTSIKPLEDITQMREIIKKQKVNGCFTLESLKIAISSVSAEEIKNLASSLSIQISQEVEELLITVIVCLYLEKKFSSQQTNWGLVVKKSKGFVKKQIEQLSISVDLETLALDFLQSKNLL